MPDIASTLNNNNNNNNNNNKKKLRDYISWRDMSYMVTIMAVVVGVVVFFWRSQAAQDDKTAGTKTHVSTVETSLKEHMATSNRIFEGIDRTLVAQQTIISDTRETLSAVKATQAAIKEENGRLAETIRAENRQLAAAIRELAKEVRHTNGHTP